MKKIPNDHEMREEIHGQHFEHKKVVQRSVSKEFCIQARWQGRGEQSVDGYAMREEVCGQHFEHEKVVQRSISKEFCILARRQGRDEQSVDGYAMREETRSQRCQHAKVEGYIAGVDEVGRGPLIGAVVTAAVILDPRRPIIGLADSKTLTEKRRKALAKEIREKALCWALGRAEPEEIDKLNILQATILAMTRAVKNLSITPDEVLVDGNRCPVLPMPSRAVIKGDSLVAEISAASILAKVARDNEMQMLDEKFPQYGFARHKGYPTAYHIEMLKKYGPIPLHRRSFAPVRAIIEAQSFQKNKEIER